MHVFSTLCLASLSAVALAGPVGRRSSPAPLIHSQSADAIADKYIVVLNKDITTASFDETLTTHSTKAKHNYNSTIKGFAGTFDKSALDELRNHPSVAYIEQDQTVKLAALTTQPDATWGIARISHREPGSSDYVYDESAGEGTCVYVIDTGIQTTHNDFGGRATFLQNFVGDGEDWDGAGHGTYVSGIVGSNTYGVAKKTQLYGLKVFDANGSTSGSAILDAMDFAAQDHPSRGCPAGVVVNMSLGGPFSQASNDAAEALVDSGAFVAVASGNDGVDAKDTSPASAGRVCTVGSSNSGDAISAFSNYGDVVDIYAPGEDITSTAYGEGDNEVTTASGTSAASPHIAGLAAYLMALEGNPGPEALCDRIIELSSTDILSSFPEGSHNRLAFNGAE